MILFFIILVFYLCNSILEQPNRRGYSRLLLIILILKES